MIKDLLEGYLLVAWFQKHNSNVNGKTGQVKWRSPYYVKNCLPKQVNDVLVDEGQLVKEVQDSTDAFVAIIEWRTKDGLEVLKDLHIEYHKWASIFSQEQTIKLPCHSGYDHCIKLVEGAKVPCGLRYGMSEQEIRGLREWLDKQVAASKITKSNSSVGAHIILVKKLDGSFRLCVDCRALNKVTVKNGYPLPMMTKLRNRLNTAKVFTKLHIKNGHHLVRMGENIKKTTAFRTRFGL